MTAQFPDFARIVIIAAEGAGTQLGESVLVARQKNQRRSLIVMHSWPHAVGVEVARKDA